MPGRIASHPSKSPQTGVGVGSVLFDLIHLLGEQPEGQG